MIGVARLMLALSSLILVGAVLMVIVTEPGTAEFTISCITVGIGLVAMGGSTLMVWWNLHRPQSKEEQQ